MPGENLHIHRENMQTPQGKAISQDSNLKPSCCEELITAAIVCLHEFSWFSDLSRAVQNYAVMVVITVLKF